jgi:hypothetical protein
VLGNKKNLIYNFIPFIVINMSCFFPHNNSILHVFVVEDRCPNFYDCGIWLGATNHANPGRFTWIYSRSDMLFPEWGTNQPNNVAGDQNCVTLMRNGTGNDVSCLNRNEFVCEKDYII